MTCKLAHTSKWSSWDESTMVEAELTQKNKVGSSKFHTTHCYFRFVVGANTVTCLRSLQDRWRNWRQDLALLTECHRGNSLDDTSISEGIKIL